MSDHKHPQVPQPFDIGARLLVLRQERGLSQRELARRAGITNANLSMIEQGRVSPSITTLEKVLVVLELPLPEFFSSTIASSAEIFSRDSLTLIKRGGSEYRLLPPPGDSDAPQLAQQTLAPGATSIGTWLGRKTWISGLVQSGELNLWLDGCSHSLHPGDGFQFHLKRPHKFSNETDTPVLVLLGVTVARDAD
jgi:transcriptional regulator with XRE-family HTH domain